ncbi:MAG: hypothetical protein WBF77_01430 [Sulfurimonadaceae bacterium]
MNELKEKVLKAQSEGDIASLYVLEAQAQELLEETDLIAYYANILDLALENLTNALESARQMDITEVQDFATLRALYEYAMEHYSAGKKADASALFEILAGLSKDAMFSSAMKMHQAAADAGMSIDAFVQTVGDVDATHMAGNFYISNFQKDAQKIIDKAGKKQ